MFFLWISVFTWDKPALNKNNLEKRTGYQAEASFYITEKRKKATVKAPIPTQSPVAAPAKENTLTTNDDEDYLPEFLVNVVDNPNIYDLKYNQLVEVDLNINCGTKKLSKMMRN